MITLNNFPKLVKFKIFEELDFESLRNLWAASKAGQPHCEAFYEELCKNESLTGKVQTITWKQLYEGQILLNFVKLAREEKIEILKTITVANEIFNSVIIGDYIYFSHGKKGEEPQVGRYNLKTGDLQEKTFTGWIVGDKLIQQGKSAMHIYDLHHANENPNPCTFFSDKRNVKDYQHARIENGFLYLKIDNNLYIKSIKNKGEIACFSHEDFKKIKEFEIYENSIFAVLGSKIKQYNFDNQDVKVVYKAKDLVDEFYYKVTGDKNIKNLRREKNNLIFQESLRLDHTYKYKHKYIERIIKIDLTNGNSYTRDVITKFDGITTLNCHGRHCCYNGSGGILIKDFLFWGGVEFKCDWPENNYGEYRNIESNGQILLAQKGNSFQIFGEKSKSKCTIF